MLFEGKDFFVDIIEVDDLIHITEVYNSNKSFLTNYMNRKYVTYDWLLEDVENMKAAGFLPCKIVNKNTNSTIGMINFKISKETYLSLFILHNDYLHKGIGSIVYKSFEDYIKTTESSAIRIDVITNYNKNSLNFWGKNNFIKLKDIELNLEDKTLSATLMKKNLLNS